MEANQAVPLCREEKKAVQERAKVEAYERKQWVGGLCSSARGRKKRKASYFQLVAATVLDVNGIACSDCVGELGLEENN